MSDSEAANELRSISLAFQGFLGGLATVLIGQLSLNFGVFAISFIYVPVFAIFYWPARASYSFSILGVVLLGLLNDLISNTPFGVWGLGYLLCFMVMGGGVANKISTRMLVGQFLIYLSLLIFISLVAAGIMPNRPAQIVRLSIAIVLVLAFLPFVTHVLEALGIRQIGSIRGSSSGRGRAEP